MRHRLKGKTLDRRRGARRALLHALLRNLVMTNRLRTTSTRAAAVREVAERLLSDARHSDLKARRRLLALTRGDDQLTKRLLALQKQEGGVSMHEVKLARRVGDGAAMVLLEITPHPHEKP